MSDTDKLKAILEIPAQDKSRDELLAILLDRAKAYLLSYCRVDMADERMMPVVISMAAEDYGRMGGEGLSYRTVSGASEGYMGDYSPRIMAQLKRFRRIGGLSC